jgi:hypothetical protein
LLLPAHGGYREETILKIIVPLRSHIHRGKTLMVRQLAPGPKS